MTNFNFKNCEVRLIFWSKTKESYIYFSENPENWGYDMDDKADVDFSNEEIQDMSMYVSDHMIPNSFIFDIGDEFMLGSRRYRVTNLRIEPITWTADRVYLYFEEVEED